MNPTKYIDIPLLLKGTSYPMTLSLYENDGVTLIDLAIFKNIVVWFIALDSGKVLQKYAYHATKGHNTADFYMDLPNKQFTIRMQKEVTLLAELDVYIINIKTSITDVKYSDDSFINQYKEKIFYFEDFDAKNVVI